MKVIMFHVNVNCFHKVFINMVIVTLCYILKYLVSYLICSTKKPFFLKKNNLSNTKYIENTQKYSYLLSFIFNIYLKKKLNKIYLKISYHKTNLNFPTTKYGFIFLFTFRFTTLNFIFI